jgi:hypothetical protein
MADHASVQSCESGRCGHDKSDVLETYSFNRRSRLPTCIAKAIGMIREGWKYQKRYIRIDLPTAQNDK